MLIILTGMWHDVTWCDNKLPHPRRMLIFMKVRGSAASFSRPPQYLIGADDMPTCQLPATPIFLANQNPSKSKSHAIFPVPPAVSLLLHLFKNSWNGVQPRPLIRSVRQILHQRTAQVVDDHRGLRVLLQQLRSCLELMPGSHRNC